MNSTRSCTVFWPAFGAFVLVAGAAYAASEPAPLQAVVVTAQLREQAAKDVPLALSAYVGEDLADRGIQTFDQFAPLAPGFQVRMDSPTKPSFVIRGIASDSGEASDEPRVSVFQDGVSISKSRGSYVELFDLERIEVTKGPQSTLYGRGALIGGVNLIENKARLGRTEASGSAEFGDGGYRMGEAVLNAPLGDTLALRLAGRVKTRDGFVDNLAGGPAFNGLDTWAYRAALNWSPSAALRVDVIGNYQRDRTTGIGSKSLIYDQIDPVSGRVLASTDPGQGAFLVASPGFEGGRGLGLNRQVWGVTAIAHWNIKPGLTLTSTTAYRQFDALGVFDADGIALPVLTAAEDSRGVQTSQELRLNFDLGQRLTGLIGLSGFHDQGHQRTPLQFDERLVLARLTNALNGGGALPGRAASDPAPASTFASTPLLGTLLQGLARGAGVTLPSPLAQAIAANLKPSHLESAYNLSGVDAADLFGDLTFRATDRLELGVGLRYAAADRKTGFSSQTLNGRSILGGVLIALAQPEPARTALLTALAAPGAAGIPTSAAYPVPVNGLSLQPAGHGEVTSSSLDDRGLTWRMTALYTLNPAVNLYANYGRGRRPTVLSAAAPVAPGGVPRFTVVAAETVDSVEAGAKTAFYGGRLHFDAALFSYWYDNFQTRVQQGTLFFTVNGGKARAYGLEGQASYAVTPNLDLFATYAFNHSRFTTGLRDGNRLRLAPDHSLSLGAAIRTPLFGGEMEARPAFTWQSRVFFDDDNDRPDLQQAPRLLIPDTVQDEVQGAYGLASLRLSYRPTSGRWNVGLFVTNLFNQTYLASAGNSGDAVGMPTLVAGEPRFIGVSLSIRR